MKKISEKNYNRLLLQAEELKFINNNKLANLILNSIGPISKEAQVEESPSKTIVHDLRESLKSDIFESIVRTLDLLGKTVEAEEVDKMSEFYSEKILKDIVK